MEPLKLADLRMDYGLTREELGEQVGVSGRTIGRLEDGQRPSPATAKAIADYFKAKPSEIWPAEGQAA